MTLALLSGATGDPINLKRRIAQQSTRGVPPPEADWKDFESNGGPFTVEPGEIERQLISLGGQPAGNLTGKIALGQGPIALGDVDPANHIYLHALGNLFKQVDINDQTTYYDWIFSLAGSGFAATSAFLAMLNDNDVTPRMRILDILVGAMRWTTSPNENLSVDFDIVAGEVDLHGLITQETGSGSTLPQVKRLHNGNYAADADLAEDGDLYVELQTVAGSVLTVRTKIGSSAAYSNSQTMNADDKWYRLQDEAGDRIGLDPSKMAEQVLIRFPSGGTYTTADEFKVLGRRAAWTQTLPVTRPISSVNTMFILDGEEIRTEDGWDVEIAWENAESVPDVAGRQTATSERSGDLVATVTPSRRVIDMTLQAALMKASTVSLVIDAEAEAEISTSGRPYRNIIICPECRVFGESFGAEAGGENRVETITLRPQRPTTTPFNYDAGGGVTYGVDGHINIVVETDIDALT
jgi:hypothetical protein